MQDPGYYQQSIYPQQPIPSSIIDPATSIAAPVSAETAFATAAPKLSAGMIAFIVIVSILLVGLIVGIIILFITKRNKNDNPSDTGAQGPKGAQGAIGAPGTPGTTGPPGARGFQGFQGAPANANVLGTPFVVACSTEGLAANIHFNTFPGPNTANYTGSYQRVGNIVTVTCSNINCVVASSVPVQIYSFKVEMPIAMFSVLSFTGVGNANRASGTTSFVQLETVTGISLTTLILQYGTPAGNVFLQNPASSNPLYETTFTIVYQTNA